MLAEDENKQHIIDEVYRKSVAQKDKKADEMVNYVKEIYGQFTDQQMSDKIAAMLTPEGTKAEVKIVYQTIEDLHKACLIIKVIGISQETIQLQVETK